MKKILMVVLSVLMILGLAACGGNEEKAGAEGEAITVISREDGSGTRGAFTEIMGIKVDDVDNTTPSAEISQSTAVVMKTVAGNTKAIGYVSLGSLTDEVKAIKVDGAEVTVDNIKAGKYPVSRPFILMTNGKESDLTKDFIKFILSGDGQKIVAEEGYITVSDAAEKYETKSGLEGKIVCAGSTSVSPVVQKLADAYREINKNVTIEIQQTGSGAGITSTAEGTCDLGMSSRELTDEEIARGIEPVTIAIDGIAVIVNKENVVEDLTSEQIRQIFTGEITEW